MTDTIKLERRDNSTDKRVILAVVGPAGAIHYWHQHSPLHDQSPDVFHSDKYGGVEIHYRECSRPTYLMDDDGRDDCWLLEEKCWHDGSSLMASETYIPLWECCQRIQDMEPFWLRLEQLYISHFQRGHDE